MYIELLNGDYDYIKEAGEMTANEYEVKGNLIHVDELMEVIKDLICEVHDLEEKIEQMEEDIQDNYIQKRYDPYAEYGVSENDFH